MDANTKIKDLRAAKGWTITELARRSGVSIATLSRIESGLQVLTLVSIRGLARAFKCSERRFLDRAAR
jgi:transcriptional regulator with XRE-family HTH domain